MSITSYSELQSAITRWIARDDMAANIPDWITAFEAVASRRLLVLSNEVFVRLSTFIGLADLPSDYLVWRQVTIDSSGVHPLEYMTPDVFNFTFPMAASGVARAFTITGSGANNTPIIHSQPYDDSVTLGLIYLQQLPPIRTFGTNWLLNDHPDAYLFGSLYHAYDFMLDLQNAAFRKAQRDEIFNEIQMLSNKSRGVGSMRLVGVPTP